MVILLKKSEFNKEVSATYPVRCYSSRRYILCSEISTVLSAFSFITVIRFPMNVTHLATTSQTSVIGIDKTINA